MFSWFKRSWLLALALFAASPAHATQVVWRSGPCPIGNDTVRVFSKVSENKLGGWDADSAAYSANGQWRTHKVATCADSLFSLVGSDMPELQPDPALAGRLSRALTQAVRELSDPENPEVWERYRIAARMYAEMDRTPFFMGELWLEASWTIRDSGVGYYEGLNGPETTRSLLDAGAIELTKGLSVEQEKAVRFNLARVAHRGGYAAERDAHLERYKSIAPMSSREAEAIGKLERAVTLEPFYQTEALRYFRLAQEDPKLTDAERARSAYLVGELQRRLGAPAAAADALSAVVQNPDLDPVLTEMARFLVRELTAKP